MHMIYIFLCFFVDLVVSYEVVPICAERWQLTYSVLWDESTEYLYFVDWLSKSRAINRYDIAKNKVYSASVEGILPVSFILPLKSSNKRFLIGDKLSAKVIEWNGKDKQAKVVREEFNVNKYESGAPNAFSTARASPKCDFYGGTLRTEFCGVTKSPNASFYRYNKRCGLQQIWDDQILSGGLDWNLNNNTFYHIDSCKHQLREYDWNPKTGAICNGRVVFDFGQCFFCKFYPLGLTVDTDGFVYVALYYGAAVWKIDPRSKKVVKKIQIPAEVCSSVTFGGKHLDTLFVTTGQRGYDLNTGLLTDIRYGGQSGSVFMVKGLNAKGFPRRRVCL